MRASTIFALIAAVLLGLGTAVGIKYSGVLDRRVETSKGPSPTLVLVAANNLYEGSYLQATDVKIRSARNSDEARNAAAGDYLPPVTQAAVRRVTKRPIPADSPIRKDDLEDLSRPQGLANSIDPCNRGVHCCLHKQYCAGGLIDIGDYVDVHLTATVEGPETLNVSGGTSRTAVGRTQSAVVARGVRVISRRNSFVPVNTPLGPDCCINYTLSTNPYRAALVDYVKSMGILSLHPVGAVERARYESESARKREEANSLRVRDNGIRPAAGTVERAGDSLPLGFCQTGDLEEDRRIGGILNGTYAISEKDLMELFGLKVVPTERPTPRTVEKFSGVEYAGYHEIGAPRFVGVGDYALASSRSASRGNVRTVSGRDDIVVDGSGQQNVLRFRAPDAACPDRTTNPAPAVRRRN